ncbi:MAG: hypothetical protein HQK83_03765 [Fibrobacteria bacterium]|nr:hypothetical protein [Fibrobacteria bacterium]
MELTGFIGTATVSVDNKGRTSLPRELRRQLPLEAGGKVIVTIFADKSLALRPVQEWNRYVTEELEPLSKKSKEGNRFVMKVTSMAKLSELDGQNRLSLSSELMTYAGIGKEITFAGDGARIRLWSPEAYKNMMNFEDNDELDFDACFYNNGVDS